MQPPRLHRDKPGNLIFNCFVRLCQNLNSKMKTELLCFTRVYHLSEQFYVLLIVSPVSLIRLPHQWVNFRVILSEQFYVLFISYFHRETETGAIFQLVQQGHLHRMKTTLGGFIESSILYCKGTCFSSINVVIYIFTFAKKISFVTEGSHPDCAKTYLDICKGQDRLYKITHFDISNKSLL